ncbi:MAG: response regulator transcription factor [Anaerolineales bacterium]|nr:response regulator transcription factor [Anaerolineales bacterium]
MPVRVLLVDDHTVMRQGIRMLLTLDTDIQVVGEAANGRDAVTLCHQLRPDVVLMDLLMPVMDGLTAITEIRRDLPEIEIVALTSVLEDSIVTDVVRAGAIGYLLKDATGEEVVQAIKAASAGEVHLSPQAAARLVRDVRAPDNPQALTARETDVLKLLAQGKSNKEIAQALNIGEKTVHSHVSNILSKLNVPSRTQAALFAIRTGLVSLNALNRNV